MAGSGTPMNGNSANWKITSEGALLGHVSGRELEEAVVRAIRVAAKPQGRVRSIAGM